MSAMIDKARLAAIEFRMAIFWFFLFSMNALGTCVLASLTGTKWGTLDGQSKFLIIVAIFVNWSGTIMAFVSRAARRINQTGEIFPQGDTQFIPRSPVDPAPSLPVKPTDKPS